MSKDDAKKIRRGIKLSSALAVAAIILLFVAFMTPPPWQIDSSVIAAAGEIAAIIALVTASEAIDRGIDAKVKHKDTELELTNPDKDK